MINTNGKAQNAKSGNKNLPDEREVSKNILKCLFCEESSDCCVKVGFWLGP